MLKILSIPKKYMEFVWEVNNDMNFSEPMLSDEKQIQRNLLNAPNDPANKVFGIFENDVITGLFVFLILEEERYMEMLVGLSKSEAAYEEMLEYLKRNYAGYEADFVYNPRNHILQKKLADMDVVFETEQQKLVLVKEVAYECDKEIIPYVPEYREQYVFMHSRDVYWIAEKVLNALDRFRVILAVENGVVVGYLDVTYQSEENEPYDIFVKEEYRGKGYEKAMLAKAVEWNRPKGMMLLVDTDKEALIEEYESLGFVKSEREKSVTAHIEF